MANISQSRKPYYLLLHFWVTRLHLSLKIHYTTLNCSHDLQYWVYGSRAQNLTSGWKMRTLLERMFYIIFCRHHDPGWLARQTLLLCLLCFASISPAVTTTLRTIFAGSMSFLCYFCLGVCVCVDVHHGWRLACLPACARYHRNVFLVSRIHFMLVYANTHTPFFSVASVLRLLRCSSNQPITSLYRQKYKFMCIFFDVGFRQHWLR